MKDWSNATSCPTEWCNKVNPGGLVNLWNCSPLNTSTAAGWGNGQWWCGDGIETAGCQTGVNASIVSYTSGAFLGTPPITRTLSSATNAPSSPLTTVFPAVSNTLSSSSSANPISGAAVPTQIQHEPIGSPNATGVASTIHASTNAAASASAETQRQSSSLPIALGVGISVPLTIATIGFLVFLFWREARLKDSRKSRMSSCGNKMKPSVDEAIIYGSPTELPDNKLNPELGGNWRTEISST